MLRYLSRLCFVLAISCSLPIYAVELDDINIPYEEFTLDNGLRVLVHTDRIAPVVAMNTWYHVGSKDEPEGKTGFAHLFEHLMFQGSENHNDEYFKPLLEAGATNINGTTSADRTNYYQTVPTEALERMLFLESDRMTHLLGAVTQERLDEQRSVVRNEKRQSANRPYGTAFEHVLRGIFPPGHPYRHPVIGSMADINAATLEDVHQWFEDYYGASNTVIALAGDIDVETAKPLMEKYFGDAPAGKPVTRLDQWVPVLKGSHREVMEDDAASPFIRRFWPVSPHTEDMQNLSLWSRAFASGPASPLHKVFVEEHGLASRVSASPIGFESAGVFSIRLSLLPDADIQKAGHLLDETLEEFLASGPDPDRLERLKMQELISTISLLEGVEYKASTLVSGAVLNDDPLHFKHRLAIRQAASAESVSAFAQKWLRSPYYELVGLPFGHYASAQEGADRSALPALSEPSNLTFPPIKERTTASGRPIVFASWDKVPFTNINLRFNFGILDEPAEKLGVALKTFEQLDKGTASRDIDAIAMEKERLGGFVFIGAFPRDSTVIVRGLTENMPELLSLVADLLQNPTFPQDHLDISKARDKARIKSDRTNPRLAAWQVLSEQVWGKDHPYGRRMRESHVDALSREALLDYHRNQVLGQPFKIFAVSDASIEAIESMVETAFADWPKAEPRPPIAEPETVALSQDVRIFLIDVPGTEQSSIAAAHPVPPAPVVPRVEQLIANEIIGGSFTSRMNMNLREDKGWSYGASTSLPDSIYQRLFSVSTSVQIDKTAETLVEIDRELREFIDGRRAEEAEFKLVRERRIRSHASSVRSGKALLGSITGSAAANRPFDYAVLYGEALQAVTLDMVRDAAEALIHPGSLTYVIAGDLSAMEDDVRALNLGEVRVVEVSM
ncbi:MAG: pitrilysin family protein [Gammaproteobacteria bacterium]|nr:pitrilysin family protein [Gammaproteobacteria bacterium]